MTSSQSHSTPGPRRPRFIPPAAHGRERDAFREHLYASAWAGLSQGVVLLTDVILAKSLDAPGWQVTLLATLTPAANLVSFYWAGQVHGRPKAGFFLLAALMGRLPLLLLLWRSTALWMIGLSFLYAVASALFITATNAILQTRYTDETRGWRFGLATSCGAFFSIVGVQTAGGLLERDPLSFPWLYGAAGLAGLLAAYHLYRMEVGGGAPRRARAWAGVGLRSLRRRLHRNAGDEQPVGLGQSLALARRVLRENPGFVLFERNYMIYGFAFMAILPVLPLYVVRDLHMNYHQLSATKGIWSQVGLVVLSPVLGIIMGRLHPLRFTGRAFLLLALYPLCLLVSTLPGVGGKIQWVYAALFFFSISMSAVNLSWSLGSMHFAGTQDASTFQGIHVALTGVRGLLAPSLGYLLYRSAGSGAVFLVSTLLFALAGVMMLHQHRYGPKPPAPSPDGVVLPRTPANLP